MENIEMAGKRFYSKKYDTHLQIVSIINPYVPVAPLIVKFDKKDVGITLHPLDWRDKTTDSLQESYYHYFIDYKELSHFCGTLKPTENQLELPF